MKVVVLCVVLLAGLARDAVAAPDPAALFSRKCTGCHTFGKGDLVGPDLKGATDRHSRSWLTTWISSSTSLISSGDPAANVLFKKYRQIPMPDQSFSVPELAALLDFLAAGGPEEEARRRNRHPETASAAEIALGRGLFAGERTFAGGGASCSACHRAGTAAGSGGSLGPELTHVYSEYQDKGLATLLARGCFPRVPDSSGQKPLTDDESFALRAFLRYAERGNHAPAASHTQSSR